MMQRLPVDRPNDLCRDTLAIVLAGGNGTRLRDLTRDHSKPALPFGGQYRNIDFPLSNCLNSGIRRIGLLTQYKAHSLIQHVHQGWNILRPELGEFIEVWPAQQRTGQSWYAGTADAVYQNLDIVEAHEPGLVLILAGDHISQMDYRPMLESHVRSGASATVACIEVPVAEASGFGVIGVDHQKRIVDFAEKPARPKHMPGRPGIALASMGIYLFDRRHLIDCLEADAADSASRHDFGHDVIPSLIGRSPVHAYDFRDPMTGRPAYWRDVGTVESYWRANLELLDPESGIDLGRPDWPIRTNQLHCAPARLVGDGRASRSILSAGCRIAGVVNRTVVFPEAEVGSGSVVENSLLLPGARIGRNCVIRNAIVDSGHSVADETQIGTQPADDARRFHVTGSGIILVTASAETNAVQIERLRVA